MELLDLASNFSTGMGVITKENKKPTEAIRIIVTRWGRIAPIKESKK